MKVAILEAGVIRVMSAYDLQKQRHEVVVYDRRDRPGSGTSWANAGQISYGYAAPRTASGIPLKGARWIVARRPPVIVRHPRLDLAMLRWLWAMLRNCSEGRCKANRTRLGRFARYTRECLAAFRRDTGIALDHQQRGTLQVFRDQATLDRAIRDSALLGGLGVPHRVVDRADCLAIEPGLRHGAAPIAGGLHLPDDETGDCAMFTAQVAALAQQRGVRPPSFLASRGKRGGKSWQSRRPLSRTRPSAQAPAGRRVMRERGRMHALCRHAGCRATSVPDVHGGSGRT